MSEEKRRVVRLRNGEDGRHLKAYLDDEGALRIDGHDLGGAEIISGSSDYEWFQAIDRAHVPEVVALLGGEPGANVLDLLDQSWSGSSRAGEFEERLRNSDIPVERFVR